MMLQWLRIIKRVSRHLAGDQRGGLLVDALVATTLLGIIGTAVVGSVQSSYISEHKFDDQAMVENIVRNQMEYALEQAYQYHSPEGTPYETVTTPAGYSVTAKAFEYDEESNKIQTVQVTVLRDGQPVKVVDLLRCDR